MTEDQLDQIHELSEQLWEKVHDLVDAHLEVERGRMMSKDNGGPAFPSTMTDDTLHVPGMTLRDYFAAKAMQGMFAADTSKSTISELKKVEIAYRMADAMLEARK